jgi:hypothetical protein
MRARILGLLATGLLAGPMTAQSSTLTPIGNITVDSTVYSVSLLSDVSSDLQTFNLLNPSITFNTAASAQAARDALVATFGLGFDWNPTCTVCFDGVRVVYGFDAISYFYFTANVLGSFGPVSSGRDVVNGFSFAQFTPVAAPEPGTLALLTLGLLGLGMSRRKA